MKTRFCKYSGCGNDFILIDERERRLPNQVPSFVAKLCDRRFGIGADGLILLNRGIHHPYRMRYFNADGGEAFCGNGIRCLASYICSIDLPQSKTLPLRAGNVDNREELLTPPYSDLKNPGLKARVSRREDEFFIESESDVYKVLFREKNLISVFHPFPKIIEQRKVAPDLNVDFLDTGVPHAVLFVPDADTVPLESLGPYLRHHPAFGDEGTNVTVASFINDETIKYRTYERGVEGETLACGTGAIAVAIASKKNLPLTLQTRSKEHLFVFCEGENHLSLTGTATFVFSGEIELRLLS